MISHLDCSRCGLLHDAEHLQNLCSCGGPLLARYDLGAAAARLRREDLPGRRTDVWRWREVLPLADGEPPLTLGEGGTPLTPSRAIGLSLGIAHLLFKDETGNPTGSFKARGLAVAVHRARALGARGVALPTMGNAGVAAAAYAKAAGLPCLVAMPDSVSGAALAAARAHGATVELVPGTLADAGAWIRQHALAAKAFDLSTLREPYRVEGKKTMGYELAEALGWELPDVIVYPTGGGTGLIGMWKAFDEMEAMGWIGGDRPRMVAVQAEGCAPIVRAFENGGERAEPVAEPRTVAAGLRVPAAIGDFLMLQILRASGGTAVAVTDEALLDGARRITAEEGIPAGPESGAAVAALPRLLADRVIAPGDRVVCFVTGRG